MLFLLALGLWGGSACWAQESTNSQTADVQAEMDQAIEQVKKIVNQPVQKYRIARNMRIATYREGWFHDGAIKPNFNTVDVRTTQENIYDKHDYVTSSLTPGVAFVGRQLEFNAMTKYFYVDRSLPKKKLTEAEMVEINRLYRIIGRCEKQLAQLQHPEAQGQEIAAEGATTTGTQDSEPDAKPEPRPRLLNPYTGCGLLAVALLVLVLVRKFR